jgi:rod shape-determining protein MreC
MDNIITRYRNVSILVAVLMLQVLGLAVQVKRDSPEGSERLLRVWVHSAITPIQKGFLGSGRWVRGLWSSYIDLRGVREENQRLQAELDRLRIERVRLQEGSAQAERIQALLGFREQFINQTIAAQVIGSSGSETSRLIVINKGSDHGVHADMAVISPDGIVGKVVKAYGASADVLLISDQSSGVGAMLESSRLHGILKGTPSGELRLQYIMSDETVKEGDRVIASGGDRIFPKGFPIGTVTKVGKGLDLFQVVQVKPAANLRQLEEVLVVSDVEYRAPELKAEEQQPRAADIRAQRLPTFKKKEAAAESGAKPGAQEVRPRPTQPPADAQQLSPAPRTPEASAQPLASPAQAANTEPRR